MPKNHCDHQWLTTGCNLGLHWNSVSMTLAIAGPAMRAKQMAGAPSCNQGIPVPMTYFACTLCSAKSSQWQHTINSSAAQVHTYCTSVFVLLPCSVHLCYSLALSQGPSYSQPHQLLQQPSVECGHPGTKMHNENTGYAALNRPDWTILIDKRHSWRQKNVLACSSSKQSFSWEYTNRHKLADMHTIYRPCQPHQGPPWIPWQEFSWHWGGPDWQCSAGQWVHSAYSV